MLPSALANDGNTGSTGFIQLLIMAGVGEPVPSLPAPFRDGAQISTSPQRSAKDARPLLKERDNRAMAAAVMTPLPADPALPLWLQLFSRQAGQQEQPAKTGQAAVAQSTDIGSVRASRPVAPEGPPLTPDGELAFAARVQPAAAASAAPQAASRTLKPEIAAPAQALSKRTAESEAADATLVQPVKAGGGASLAAYGQFSSNSDAPSPARPSATSAPLEVKPVLQAQPKSATVPMKDISLQLTQNGAQKVEVRLVQQSGELRVAVRTGDSDLAHNLQQGLSDLVGRLQETGLRAEAWRPGGSSVQSPVVLESRTSQGSSQNGDTRSYSGGSHQQQDERQQNQSQRPDWVEELENNIASGEQTQGVSYGIGN